MPVFIPFQPSENNYRIIVPLQNVPYIFDVRWNTRDSAWYFDLRHEDETPILCNCKLLLGVRPGHASTDPFFAARVFQVFDTSNQHQDATFDDLGVRVQLLVTDISEALPQ